MLAGEFPFVRVERVMALTEGKHPPVKWPEDLNVSDEAKHLVERILEFDASKALTLEQVQSHPWFTLKMHTENKES